MTLLIGTAAIATILTTWVLAWRWENKQNTYREEYDE